jgi:hypothetical protein
LSQRTRPRCRRSGCCGKVEGISADRGDVQVEALGAVEDAIALDDESEVSLNPIPDAGGPRELGDRVVADDEPVAVHQEDPDRVVLEVVVLDVVDWEYMKCSE